MKLLQSHSAMKSQEITKNQVDSNLLEYIEENLYGINSTHTFLANLPTDQFIDLIDKSQHIPSFQQWMNYYLWLFRNETEFRQILSHSLFPTKFLIQFIYYALGKWISQENDPDEFFMEIASIFTPEKCLQILIKEQVVDLDVNFALALISNLDEKGMSFYFNESGNPDDVANFFYTLFNELEDSMIKSFFIKNPELYAYILQIFKAHKDKSEKHQKKFEKFILKFKTDLEMIDLILYIKEKVTEKFDMDREKQLPYSKRNLNRILGIVNTIKDNENIKDILQILYRQRIIIDREEKELIKSILTDEYIKNIFKISENSKL